MKLFIIIIFSLILTNFFICTSSAKELKNPGELFGKMKSSYKNIKSYSYTNSQGEYDIFSKEYQKETAKNYGDLDEKYGDGKSQKVSDKPEYKKGLYEVQFEKPYSIRMKIISSDYTPSVLNNGEFIYSPSKDPKNFTIKILGLGFIPLEFTRDVQKENTGDFLVMNWTVDLMEIEYLFKNGIASLSKGKINNNQVYILKFNFPENLTPTVPSYKLGDIPSEVKYKIDYAMGSLARAKYSSKKYWVDGKNFVIIKREEYIKEKLHSTRIFSEIKIN